MDERESTLGLVSCHAYLDLVPSWILETQRMMAYDKAVEWLKTMHRRHGFDCSDADGASLVIGYA